MTVFDNGDESGFASGGFFRFGVGVGVRFWFWFWFWGKDGRSVQDGWMEGREGGRGGEAITMWSEVRWGRLNRVQAGNSADLFFGFFFRVFFGARLSYGVCVR